MRRPVSSISNLGFAELSTVFGVLKITTEQLNQLTHHCHIVEAGNDSCRFKQSTTQKEERTTSKQ